MYSDKRKEEVRRQAKYKTGSIKIDERRRIWVKEEKEKERDSEWKMKE